MILLVLTPSTASAEETSELQYHLPCELAHAASVSGSRRRPGQTALRAHERHRIVGLTLRSRYTESTPEPILCLSRVFIISGRPYGACATALKL
jgi:hypothetical protein